MVAASRGPAPAGHNRLVVPAATITAAVTGQPEPAADRPAVSPIEALIARSQMSDRARVRALGARIVKSVAELRGVFQVDEAEQKAVERIAQARRELDAANDALKKLRQKPTAKPAAGTGATREDNRAAREWAAANKIDCPRTGRVPGRIVDAWREATS